jgi:hypothetical protein
MLWCLSFAVTLVETEEKMVKVNEMVKVKVKVKVRREMVMVKTNLVLQSFGIGGGIGIAKTSAKKNELLHFPPPHLCWIVPRIRKF